MERTKVIDRVRKLLRLSESPNSNEAKSAYRLAHKMIADYSLEREEYLEHIIQEAFIEVEVKKHTVPWERDLLQHVATFCSCRTFTRYTKDIFIFGESQNIDVAVLIYKSVHNQIFKQVAAIKKTDMYQCLVGRGPRKSFLAQYRAGLVEGVRQQLNEITKTTQANGTALVKYQGKVKEAMYEAYPNMRKLHKKRTRPSVHGIHDAKNITIHTKLE